MTLYTWFDHLYAEDIYLNIEAIKEFETHISSLSTECIHSKQFYDILKDLAHNPHKDFLVLYLAKLRGLRILLKEHFNPNRLVQVLEIFCQSPTAAVREEAWGHQRQSPERNVPADGHQAQD
jgi:hypothetical protein